MALRSRISNTTRPRFLARTTQHDYIDIIPSSYGCFAQLPYILGAGRQLIGLDPGYCVTLKVVSLVSYLLYLVCSCLNVSCL